MQNLRYKSCKWRGFFFFVSIHIIHISAMNSTMLSRDLPLKPEKIITIFDPHKEVERGKLWNEVVPGAITITADGTGVVISEYGKVRYSRFDGAQGCETIIEHPCVKHSPMISTAQKDDGSLLVISAGNYINQANKRVAEYILFCNGYSKLKKLDWPIQAISLDSCGKNLAIAGQRSIDVVDLETDTNASAFFRYNGNPENWIVDMTINPEGKAVIAVGSKGGIQWMLLSKNKDAIDLSTLKYAVSDDEIKKIYYPSSKELLYVTYNGNAKIIAMHDFLEPSGDHVGETILFARSLTYDNISADPSEHIVTAHWTNNVKVDKRNKIKIYRKKNECVEKIILEVPELENRYSFITELGNYGSAIGRLLHVALRGKYVIALGTDGKMRVWSLPEQQPLYGDADKKTSVLCSKSPKVDSVFQKDSFIHAVEPKRRHSSFTSHTRQVSVNSTEKEEKQPKKTTWKKNIKIYSGYNSRETTPPSSRGNSPSRPSDRGEKFIVPEVESKDKDLIVKDYEDGKTIRNYEGKI